MSRLSNALASSGPDTNASCTPLILIDPAGIAGLPPAIAKKAVFEGFEGKLHSFLLVFTDTGDLEAVYVGCGADEGADRYLLAGVADKLPTGAYRLKGYQGTDMALVAHGWAMGQYRFSQYKSQKPSALSVLHLTEPGVLAAARQTVAAAEMVRDLINTPADDMGPAQLEQAAETLASGHGADVSVIRGDALLDAGFPAVYAVGRAAGRGCEPRLIEVNWAGSSAGSDAPTVALVGKGVCFDTGGLNLKGGDSMLLMKKDMGGAAHVLGLASLIMARDLPIRLHVVVPAVENAVSGNAFRPGDILSTRAGVTVEVGNTDAEGRLILSDALTYAAEAKPDVMIDYATLTGAARVAMGPDLPPVFTDHDDLWSRFEAGASAMQDPVWRLPLWAPYEAMLDSHIADVSNIGSSGMAGAITAGLFLKRFAGNTKWAHIDVYSWSQSDRPGRRKGGLDQALLAGYFAINSLIS